MLNVDDKADEDDFENDIEEEHIVDDEDYKEKDEENKDEDDDDKVVKLTNMNAEHSYQDDDSTVLISFNENEDDETLSKAKLHGCMNTSIEKVSQNLMVASKYVNYNTSAIQTQLSRL
jgi:uncharacterized protein (DUF934 family)